MYLQVVALQSTTVPDDSTAVEQKYLSRSYSKRREYRYCINLSHDISFFCFFFGCMVASRGGYRMARGRHYAKLPLSNAARLSFSDLCILLFLFLSLCRLCVCVFLCSHWSLVDVPLIFFCPADHVPDWQPRVLLGMVEARSVNVKKTTTKTTTKTKKLK